MTAAPNLLKVSECYLTLLDLEGYLTLDIFEGLLKEEGTRKKDIHTRERWIIDSWRKITAAK